MLTDLCVYTIKHSDDLNESHRKGGRDTYQERKKWVKAKDLLEEAKEQGKHLPVVFAPAEMTRYLFAWAILSDVAIAEGTTTYSFSGLTLFDKRRRKTTLRKANDNTPLADWYVRPYAICHTPGFLRHQTEERLDSEPG